MPNHIQNRLKVIGTEAEIKEVLSFIASKDKDGNEIEMDFNKIMPMPEGLDCEPHSGITTAVNVALKRGLHENELVARMEAYNREKSESPLSFSDSDWQLFIQCLQNVRLFGFPTWYEWSIKNWGTKWNAYSQSDKRNTSDTIYFQTAWSAPVELMRILSSKFPTVTIELTYADEDSGSNDGKITLVNGVIKDSFLPPSQSNEAYDIYFELHPGRNSDFKMIDGKYQYVETED